VRSERQHNGETIAYYRAISMITEIDLAVLPGLLLMLWRRLARIDFYVLVIIINFKQAPGKNELKDRSESAWWIFAQ
jgi:hypothetical protein